MGTESGRNLRSMKRYQHTAHGKHLRRAVAFVPGAQMRGWKASTVAFRAGVVAVTDSLAATINPRGVSGGFPREGNP
jgi:hypothetical protein